MNGVKLTAITGLIKTRLNSQQLLCEVLLNFSQLAFINLLFTPLPLERGRGEASV
jgi:hypothetical protein